MGTKFCHTDDQVRGVPLQCTHTELTKRVVDSLDFTEYSGINFGEEDVCREHCQYFSHVDPVTQRSA